MEECQKMLSWLALNRIPDIGSVSQRKLLAHFGSIDNACHAGSAALSAFFSTTQAKLWLDFCQQYAGNGQHGHGELFQQALRDYDAAAACGAQIVHAESEHYPLLLAQCHSAPTVLYARGDHNALHLPQLAIVGSRNASKGGLELAQEFAAHLSRHGLAVTSGLALGIDGAAHRGALAVAGKTIAVVATGLDEVYPRRHEKLSDEILAGGGVLVSEFAPRTPPVAQNFPRRNRIISGLSLGTLVVEASLQSGSLITARYAMEQGREVFALPGSVRSLYHRGCHALIRQGAKLVESTSDIVEELGGLLAFKQQESAVLRSLQQKTDDWSEDAVQVFKLLDHTPVALDVLAARSTLSIESLSAALMDLELEAAIAQQHGLYSRA